ncbi:zinc finger protein CONSTANS-LIKE 3-like [Primulina eburnea]|uniref:zinc finger protein CONSTANS-LIKE 3-like n=1 Tax=Primulina eburnea TaxID=1245227 RepID=UPI003C6C09C4
MKMSSGGAARTRCFQPAFHSAAKPCDYCKSTAALLFCRAESAFICMPCDSKVHNNISTLKHERVWMCEVCEQAPAAVTCKADAASLCVSCDNDIHCANPLARRHERSPVFPFYDTAESMLLKSSATAFPAPISDSADKLDNFITQNSYITDSWVSTNPIASTKYLENNRFVKPTEILFSDSDQFLDFDSFPISTQPCSDSVVPVQTITKPPVTAHLVDNSPEIQFDIDFKKSSITSYNSYNNSSHSRSISSSTMEVGVVPDGSTLSETSYPFARTMPSVDISGNQGSQVVDMDREARVLRYKEKKKNRKFEKTIRYASRKAYAEIRPRIKGRFVKRTDSEPDINRFFGSASGNFIVDAGYGVVPSF